MYDFLMLPVNKNGNHWVFLVARMKDHSVMVYDSLSGDNTVIIERFW